MKNVKVLLAAAIVLTTAFSLGVQSNYPVSVEAASRVESSIQQDGKNVSIKLKGNPTTGYAWKCNVKNSGITNAIYQDYISDDTTGEIDGAGGTYIWKFAGFWQGETEVTFTYEKEGEAEPAETITYIVSVDSDLNIKFTQKDAASEAVHGTVQFKGNEDIIKYWKYQDNDNSIVDVTNSGYSSLDNNLYGNQKILSWDVKGLKEGETEIKFIYDDSSDVKAYRTRTFLVKVDSDLNVTLSEEKYKLESESNVILLDGNASTGYEWQYDIKDKEIAKVTGQKYISHDDTGELCGSGETNAWAFEGLKEGETEVTFNYLRPWETEIEKTVTYIVKVDSNLNITISQK